MEDISLNVDDALANIEMEMPKINCLSTPLKSQCNDSSFNDFNGSTNSKVVWGGDYKPFKAKDGFKGTVPPAPRSPPPPSTTCHLDSSVMNSLKSHIKSLQSEIQFLRKGTKEKNTLISSLIPLKILQNKYCEASNLQNSNSRISCLQEREKKYSWKKRKSPTM